MANQKQSDVAFLMYKDWSAFFELLTDSQVASLMKAIFEFQNENKDFITDDVQLKTVWAMIMNTFKRDNKKYEERCEKNREKANKRWHNQKADTKNAEDEQSPSYDINAFEYFASQTTPTL